MVGGNFKFYDGTTCRLFINDIPVVQGFKGKGYSENGTISHYLVPGENELKLEILAAPPPRGGRCAYQPPEDPQMGARDLNQSVTATIFKEYPEEAGMDEGDFDIIYHCMFPDLWQHIPEDERQLPYMHVAKFTPGVHVEELAFIGAPMQEIPCEGTRELHDAVRDLHEAFLSGDASRLKDQMQLQIEEYDVAHYGGTVKDQHDSIEELLAEQLVVAPLDWEQMHFHARANGRIVHVERLDRQPILKVQTIGKPQGHMSDPVFTHHQGRWQLM